MGLDSLFLLVCLSVSPLDLKAPPGGVCTWITLGFLTKWQSQGRPSAYIAEKGFKRGLFQ